MRAERVRLALLKAIMICLSRSRSRKSVPRIAGLLGVVALTLAAGGGPARAEVSEVKIGSGFGIHYLPFYVMEREGLVEKHAKALGMPALKASYTLLSGGAAFNDALLSGSLDVIGTGVGPFAILWDKTKGAIGVRALAAMGDIPLVLVTNEARITTLRDLREGDKIAVPAVRSSMQATLLQMAAAKELGDANYKDFDRYTVTMSHADAATSLIARSGIVDVHFSVAPYSTRELEKPGIHRITSAADIVGGPMSFNLVSATERFSTNNPIVCRAVFEALNEAMSFIKSHRAEAARYFFEGNKGAATDVKMVEDILADPQSNYTTTPHGVGAYVAFMQRAGLVKNKPSAWTDMFFPIAHDLPGN